VVFTTDLPDSHSREESMLPDKRLALRVAIFSTIGFIFTVFVVTFVDSHVTSHVLRRQREYPLGYWICALGLLVFPLTYLPLAKTRRPWFAIFWPFGSLSLACAGALPNFPPVFPPHGGITTWLFLYSLSGVATAWIRLRPTEATYIEEKTIPTEIKLERIKAAVAFWQTFATGLVLGYAGIAIAWCGALWNCPLLLVTKPEDVALMSTWNMSAVAVFSVCAICGPLFEAYANAHKAADLMLTIRDVKKSGTVTY
jgi:hypothetical protein